MAARNATKKTARTAKKTTKRSGTTRAKAKPQARLSTSHKTAMSTGRNEGRIVREYLDALDAVKPKRGRQVSEQELNARLTQIHEEIRSAKRSERVFLVQRRMDIEKRLAVPKTVNITPLEKAFVKVGKNFALRKNISYHAFREVGVPAAVLADAGIAR